GYRGNLDATMRAFHNLWYHTGDEGFINNQGELHFLGRLGDGIRRRGVNISSVQVEFEILQNPKVLECAVIGVPADLGEHDILAFIVWLQVPLDEQLALKELSDFIFERLPKQYAPRFLQGIEILPRTNTGKLQKRLLPLTTSERRWDRENI
ncbi:MAG: ATP-dependent acyl-CoA ligase, partial [Betaproteobacteria bacterium]